MPFLIRLERDGLTPLFLRWAKVRDVGSPLGKQTIPEGPALGPRMRGHEYATETEAEGLLVKCRKHCAPMRAKQLGGFTLLDLIERCTVVETGVPRDHELDECPQCGAHAVLRYGIMQCPKGCFDEDDGSMDGLRRDWGDL